MAKKLKTKKCSNCHGKRTEIVQTTDGLLIRVPCDHCNGSGKEPKTK